MTLYTCVIDEFASEAPIDSADPGEYVGQELQCWIPGNGEIYGDRRPVTFVAPVPPEDPPAEAIGDGQTVADFLGRGDDTELVAMAGQHVAIVRAMVKAYTRDRGFTDDLPGDDLAAVIVSACARLVANPEHNVMVALGTFTIRPGIFNGWTLPELAILNRYRKRAA